MKKLLKITAWVVGIILAVALVLPLAFRGKIAGIVKDQANEMLAAKLDFEDLDLSLLRHFPHASVELTGLTLTGAEPFRQDTVVAADRISVVVNLMSLFGDSGFEITKVFLDRPSIYGHKLADGKVSWDVMKPSDEPAEEQTPEDEATAETAESSAFRMQVRDFNIFDASIRYEDDSVKMQFRTSPLSLSLKGDLSADKTDLKLNLKAKEMTFLSGGVRLLNRTEAEIDADIEADLKNLKFTLSDNKFRLNSIVMALDGWVELADNAVKMDLKAGCDKVLFKDVLSLVPAFYTRDFKQLTAGGELAMNLWAKGELTDKNLPAFELKTAVKNGSFRYSSLPKAVEDITMDLKVSNAGGPMDRTVVDLKNFGLRLDQNALKASFYATNLLSDPFLRAAVNGKIDLGAVKMVYPLGEGENFEGVITADLRLEGNLSSVEKQLYEKLGAEGTFVVEGVSLALNGLPEVKLNRAAATITPAAMTLGEFNAEVGRSDIAAHGQLTGYLGFLMRDEMLSGRLYVSSNMLDLNEFMDQTAAEEQTSVEEATEAVAAEPIQVIEVPKNMNLSLSTDLKEIKMMKMNISNAGGEMRVKDGALSLNNLHLNIFDGKATASGSYSTADPANPSVNMSLSFADASFKKTFEELEMIRQLVPVFAKTGGNYTMKLDLKTRLDQQMTPVMQSVSARGEIRSANVEVMNIEAFNKLATLLNNKQLNRIVAKHVDIKFVVKDGRMTTQPFDLKMGNININLSGSTGLDQTIDYVAKVAVGSSKAIPVEIGGTFSDPKLKLGVKDMVGDAVKDKVHDKLNDLTGGKLPSRDLETRKQQICEGAKTAGDKLIVAAQKQRQKMIDNAAGKKRYERKIAEKAGDKLVKEAEAQAAKLMKDAEEKIAKLEADNAAE